MATAHEIYIPEQTFQNVCEEGWAPRPLVRTCVVRSSSTRVLSIRGPSLARARALSSLRIDRIFYISFTSFLQIGYGIKPGMSVFSMYEFTKNNFIMHVIQLTLLCFMLSFISGAPALEYSPSPAAAPDSTRTNNVELGPTNVILQSKDGGQTWQDISNGLPAIGKLEDFFAGESDLYLRFNNETYRSKSNLETPVWEKENELDPRCTSVVFNRSGVMAYNYEGQIYQEKPLSGTWLPVYATFTERSVRTIFEASDGTVFLGCDGGLYKSADKGQTWKQVHDEGGGDLVESEGVLIATGPRGIMRSTDKGETWEWVIREGGVGIAVERIDGGFAAISCNSSTLSRRIRTSFDSGKTWTAIDEELEPSLFISSIKQIGEYLICGHPDGIFRSADMGKTWHNVHPSVDEPFNPYRITPLTNGRVFDIHVSGSVLYAVAKSSGC